MSKQSEVAELARKIEQAERLASPAYDQTTLRRIRNFIAELKQQLERRRSRRRSLDETRMRAFQLWERAAKPEGRAEEFWLQAERELASRGTISELPD
jgi:Protein of unknown function (DUF2934)